MAVSVSPPHSSQGLEALWGCFPISGFANVLCEKGLFLLGTKTRAWIAGSFTFTRISMTRNTSKVAPHMLTKYPGHLSHCNGLSIRNSCPTSQKEAEQQEGVRTRRQPQAFQKKTCSWPPSGLSRTCGMHTFTLNWSLKLSAKQKGAAGSWRGL